MSADATTSEQDSAANTSVSVTPSPGAPSASETKKPKPERRPRGGYDPQLEWFILSGDAAMGASGTLAGVVSQIERGQVGGSGRLDAVGSFIHPYTDLQLGTGTKAVGEVELHRHLTAAWRLLPLERRNRLCSRYTPPKAAFRSDEGFGALDRFVEGSDGRTGQHAPTRTGTKLHLGEYANLAFALCDDPAQLLIACVEPRPVIKGKINQAEATRRSKVVKAALARAHAVDAEDHAAWFAAKGAAAPLRTFEERIGRPRTELAPRRGNGPRAGRLLTMSDASFARVMESAQVAAAAAMEASE